MYLLGQNIQLYVAGESIAFAKNSQIDISVDTVDVSNKDFGGYEAVEAGLVKWTMSSENLVANKRSGKGFDDLMDLLLKKEAVEVIFGTKDAVVDRNDEYTVPETGGWPVPTKGGWKGKALITSLSMSTPNAEQSTMNVTLTGCSPLTKVAAEATSTMSLRTETNVTKTTATKA